MSRIIFLLLLCHHQLTRNSQCLALNSQLNNFLLNCELNSLLKLPNASFLVIFLFGVFKCRSPFPWHNQCISHGIITICIFYTCCGCNKTSKLYLYPSSSSWDYQAAPLPICSFSFQIHISNSLPLHHYFDNLRLGKEEKCSRNLTEKAKICLHIK